MEQVIEGTWDEIKQREADLVGHRLMVIIDPIDPPYTVRDAAHVEELLREGLNSGPAIKVTPEYWDEKLKKLVERPDQKNRP